MSQDFSESNLSLSRHEAEEQHAACDSQATRSSSATVAGQAVLPSLLSALPPVYILETHMNGQEFHSIADKLIDHGARLTYDLLEARIFISKIQQPRRAKLELRALKLETQQISKAQFPSSSLPQKRARSSSGDSTADSVASPSPSPGATESNEPNASSSSTSPIILNEGTIVVVREAWLEACVETSQVAALDKFVVYVGQLTSDASAYGKGIDEKVSYPTKPRSKKEEILARAKADNNEALAQTSPQSKAYISTSQRNLHSTAQKEVAALIRESTSHHDRELTNDLPAPPDWVKQGLKYSCQRRTPVEPPNAEFISLLKKIRDVRKLTADEIGVRAYSTAIAALAAYPHTLISPREILGLPGCNNKIAALFAEWKNNGARPRALASVRDLEDDPKLRVLREFYEIWGVGPSKAREMYARGRRDLDDVIEFEWNNLSRVQQLGLKFYDEFQLKIPRAEVEAIEATVAEHTRAVLPDGVDSTGVRTCIVGGYRRGKAESGDADIIVSHVETHATQDLVGAIVASLAREGWVTHKLITQLGGSRRGQEPKSYVPGGSRNIFDSLDKALVVWQNPDYAKDKFDKNPNTHRRVDIIVAPWPRIGCAVLGWSAGTTFERDLRRYADKVKGWRFDSSGIRDRATGQVVEVELEGGTCVSIDEAERKVFKALDLDFIPPWERCTG